MHKQKKDLVLIRDGDFEVFDAEEITDIPEEEDTDATEEVFKLLRSDKDRKALKGHSQRSGRMAPKSWGIH